MGSGVRIPRAAPIIPLLLVRIQQFARFYTQCLGEFRDDKNGWISDAALYAADVSPVHVRIEGKLFLRQAFQLSVLPHILPYDRLDIHAAIAQRCRLLIYRL